MDNKFVVVYNATDNAIPLRDGKERSVMGRDWAAAEQEKVQEDIDRGDLVVKTDSEIPDYSDPRAVAAKERCAKLNQGDTSSQTTTMVASQSRTGGKKSAASN